MIPHMLTQWMQTLAFVQATPLDGFCSSHTPMAVRAEHGWAALSFIKTSGRIRRRSAARAPPPHSPGILKIRACTEVPISARGASPLNIGALRASRPLSSLETPSAKGDVASNPKTQGRFHIRPGFTTSRVILAKTAVCTRDALHAGRQTRPHRALKIGMNSKVSTLAVPRIVARRRLQHHRCSIRMSAQWLRRRHPSVTWPTRFHSALESTARQIMPRQTLALRIKRALLFCEYIVAIIQAVQDEVFLSVQRPWKLGSFRDRDKLNEGLPGHAKLPAQ